MPQKGVVRWAYSLAMTIVVDLGQIKQNTNISASTKLAASTKFAAGTKNPASTKFAASSKFCARRNFCASSKFFASRNFCASNKFCASKNFCASSKFVLAANFVLAGIFVPAANFVLAAIFVLAGIFVFCLFCFFTSPSQLLWPLWDGQLTLSHRSWGSLKKRLTSTLSRERECLTRDRVAAGSSLAGGIALCPWARSIYPSLVPVQPRKTRPYITERSLMGRNESNHTSTSRAYFRL